MGFIISGNVVTECGDHAGDYGIDFAGDHHTVSGNRVRNCRWGGINFGGTNNILIGNDIENCTPGFRFGGDGNTFTKNNFKNYSRGGFWFFKSFLYPVNNRWVGNYWDTWTGIGPKIIPGLYVMGWRVAHIIPILFLFPTIDFDWRPAREPYDIGGLV
jgi:parallel beta-helix repeat protein